MTTEIKKPENLKWLKNVTINEDSLYCACGEEADILHCSNWHDGTGVFYVQCPECRERKGGFVENRQWNVSWKENK